MKQRNVMAVIFFSIITLGIYDLFWLTNTKKVLNQETPIKVPSIWIVFAPIIIFVAAFIAFFITQASKLHTTTYSYGASTTTTSSGSAAVNIVFIAVDGLAFLVLIPVTFYWFFKFSKAVNAYTKGEISTAVSFLLLFVLRFIGMAVIQDKFNEIGTAAAVPVTEPVAPSVQQPQAHNTPPTPPTFVS